jgi:hypothetical protein
MYQKKNVALRRIGAVLLILPIMALTGWRVGVTLEYGRSIEGRLKRAADANTVEMAERELQAALTVMEARGMTSGYSSVFYQTPDDDIGYWHNNLKTSLEELEALPQDASPLEKSNMLLKLRETILDHDSDGESVTAPSGISVFPHNKLYALLCILFSCMAVGGCVVGMRTRYLTLKDIIVLGGVCTAAFLVPMGLFMF